MSGARSLWWAAGSLGVVLAGTLGPRATTFGLSVDGSRDEFIAIAALVAALALASFVVTQNRRLAAVPLLASLLSAGLIGHDLNDPASPLRRPVADIQLEWGIWTALAGSIGLALASTVLLAQTTGRPFRIGMARGSAPRTGFGSAAVRPRWSIRRPAIRVRERMLGLFADDAVVKEFAARLNRSDERGGEILGKLVAQLHRKPAGTLVEQCTPVHELDYARHRIELLVSSPQIGKRLGSVEKEPFTVEWIERSIRPGDVFYDIGANVGPYSLIAAKATGNGVRVFAFEPSPSSFRDLSQNVLLNGCSKSITPIPLALWSETQLLAFTLRSLSAGAAKHRVSSDGSSETPLTETVLGVRLDDLVERFGLPVPTHAKIDVDGYELEVLRGAERALKSSEWRSIIIELDPSETERNRTIKELLAEAGFDAGHRHDHLSSRRHPNPDARPVVYWTFVRRAAS